MAEGTEYLHFVANLCHRHVESEIYFRVASERSVLQSIGCDSCSVCRLFTLWVFIKVLILRVGLKLKGIYVKFFFYLMGLMNTYAGAKNHSKII